jgi:hypothetical protein
LIDGVDDRLARLKQQFELHALSASPSSAPRGASMAALAAADVVCRSIL